MKKHFSVYLFVFLFIIIQPFIYAQNSQDVTKDDIEEYTISFLLFYQTLVEGVDIEYRNNFSFYRNFPYNATGFISPTQNGSGVLFSHMECSKFEVMFLHPRAKIKCFDFEFAPEASIGAEDFNFERFNMTFFMMHDSNGALWGIIKSIKLPWNLETARHDAEYQFMWELYTIFGNSKEYRIYLAYPEIKEMIDEINEKRRNKLYPDYISFKKDFNRMIEVGKEEYNISSDFIEELYTYEYNEVKIQQITEKSNWEKLSTLMQFLGIPGLLVIILYFISRRRKQKNQLKK